MRFKIRSHAHAFCSASHCVARFTGTQVRSDTTSKIVGGINTVLGEFLKYFLHPTDARVAGVTIHLPDGRVLRIFLELGCVVADEDAHRAFFRCKGASGTKPCMLCLNCVKWRQNQNDAVLTDHDSTGMLVPHTCPDVSRFVLHSSNSLSNLLSDMLIQKRTLSQADFALLEQAHGWNDPTNSCLVDPVVGSFLSPAEQVSYDWAHVYIVHGIFNATVGLFMHQMSKHHFKYDTLHGFLQFWRWPKRLASRCASGVDAFKPKRARSHADSKNFGASASESLSLFLVIAHLVRSAVPEDVEPLARVALLACCDVLGLLMAVPRGIVSPQRLRRAIETQFGSFIAAFGEERVVPKFHYALHLPLALERHGTLWNCLTHERKHKVVKRYLTEATHTSRNLLRDVTCDHLASLQRAHFHHKPCLQPPLKNVPIAVHNALSRQIGMELAVAPQTSMNAHSLIFGTCSVGDVLFGRRQNGEHFVGRVVSFVQFGTHETLILLSEYGAEASDEHHGTYSIDSPRDLVVGFDSIVDVLMWTESTDTSITVLYTVACKR